MRVKMFKKYNQNQDGSTNQDMISNDMHSFGLLLYTNKDPDHRGSYYIMSIYRTGGVKVLEDMLANDEDFLAYMANPYHRILFYLDLVRIWKKLAEEMYMRICVGSPSTITVRVPDGDNPTYRPIFRHPEWAVGLGHSCKNYVRNYTSKSVLINDIESTETYQNTIETFTLGRIIVFVEIMMAHKVYESVNGVTTILDEFAVREAKIFRHRSSKEEKYKNESLF